jgi:hypothetical protein
LLRARVGRDLLRVARLVVHGHSRGSGSGRSARPHHLRVTPSAVLNLKPTCRSAMRLHR